MSFQPHTAVDFDSPAHKKLKEVISLSAFGGFAQPSDLSDGDFYTLPEFARVKHTLSRRTVQIFRQ